MHTVSTENIRYFNIQRQLLDGSGIDLPIETLIEKVFGLHATYSFTSFVSLFARKPIMKRQDLLNVFEGQKKLGKIRSARKTLYMYPAHMFPLIYAATGSMIENRSEYYLKNYGFTLEQIDLLADDLLNILQFGPLNIADIKKRLGTTLNISPAISYLCDTALLTRRHSTGWKGNAHKYAVFDSVFPNLDLYKYSQNEGLQWMITEYLRVYGPASWNDICWWTGQKRTLLKEVFKNIENITSIKTTFSADEYFLLEEDLEALLSISKPKEPIVNFLPFMDQYLMGYKERQRFASHEEQALLYDQMGNASLCILINGKVEGIWQYNTKAKSIQYILFSPVNKKIKSIIEQKAKAVGEYILDTKPKLIEENELLPFALRDNKSFFSPFG